MRPVFLFLFLLHLVVRGADRMFLDCVAQERNSRSSNCRKSRCWSCSTRFRWQSEWRTWCVLPSSPLSLPFALFPTPIYPLRPLLPLPNLEFSLTFLPPPPSPSLPSVPLLRQLWRPKRKQPQEERRRPPRSTGQEQERQRSGQGRSSWEGEEHGGGEGEAQGGAAEEDDDGDVELEGSRLQHSTAMFGCEESAKRRRGKGKKRLVSLPIDLWFLRWLKRLQGTRYTLSDQQKVAMRTSWPWSSRLFAALLPSSLRPQPRPHSPLSCSVPRAPSPVRPGQSSLHAPTRPTRPLPRSPPPVPPPPTLKSPTAIPRSLPPRTSLCLLLPRRSSSSTRERRRKRQS